MRKQTKKRKHLEESVSKISLADGEILYDNILIKPIVLEQDGVVLRPQQYEDKPEWGEVIAYGEGRIFDNGVIVPLKVKKGSIVLFQKYSAQKFRHNGEDYIIIREDDVHFVYDPKKTV